MDKQLSPRELAKSWPFKRHLDFEKRMRNAASQWFKRKGYETQKRGYILAKYDDWHENIICQNVAEYIKSCLLYTSPSPRDRTRSRMPSSA